MATNHINLNLKKDENGRLLINDHFDLYKVECTSTPYGMSYYDKYADLSQIFVEIKSCTYSRDSYDDVSVFYFITEANAHGVIEKLDRTYREATTETENKGVSKPQKITWESLNTPENEYIIARLLFNALGHKFYHENKYDAYNLTGSLYIPTPKGLKENDKTNNFKKKDEICLLELVITRYMNVSLNVRTFTDKKLLVNEKHYRPEYILEDNLFRRVIGNNAPNDKKRYCLSKKRKDFRNDTKNIIDAAFFGLIYKEIPDDQNNDSENTKEQESNSEHEGNKKDKKKYVKIKKNEDRLKETKFYQLGHLINDFHSLHGEYATVSFENFVIDKTIKLNNKDAELVNCIVQDHPNVEIAITYSYGCKAFAENLLNFLEKFQKDNEENLPNWLSFKLVPIKKVNEPALYCVPHYKTLKEGQRDPYYDLKSDYAVQHITADSFKIDFSSTTSKGNKNQLIDRSNNGRIKQNSKILNTVLELLIKQDIIDGQISIIPWEDYHFEKSYTFAEVVQIHKEPKDKEIQEWIISALTVSPTGRLEHKTYHEMSNNLKLGDPILQIVDDTYRKHRDLRANKLIIDSDGNVNVLYKSERITLPKDLPGIVKDPSQINRKYSEKSNDSFINNNLPAMTNINSRMTEDSSTLEYVVGTPYNGYREKQTRAHNIKALRNTSGTGILFKELLPTLKCYIVRYKQPTVYPFPFKYVREAYNIEKYNNKCNSSK